MITPAVGVELAGYGFGPSAGILAELEAQALVLERGGERAAIESADLQDGLELAAEPHSVRLTVPAYGMATVRCRGATRWPSVSRMAYF